MFLGYQLNELQQEFIAGVANTKEELENSILVKYIRIEETKDSYVLIGGKYQISTSYLNNLKTKKKEEINQARDKTEQGGFEYMGKIFDSDLISCVRIQGAAQLAAQMPMSDTPIIEWTCKDNTHIKLTPAELIGLSAALANWSNECHKKASELKQQVDDAQTEEELNAIKW